MRRDLMTIVITLVISALLGVGAVVMFLRRTEEPAASQTQNQVQVQTQAAAETPTPAPAPQHATPVVQEPVSLPAPTPEPEPAPSPAPPTPEEMRQALAEEREKILAANPEMQLGTEISTGSVDLIDPSMRPPLTPEQIQQKVLRFNLKPGPDDNENTVLTVTVDARNHWYRVTSNEPEGFAFSYANGIVCFRKTAYVNDYCLREKYFGPLVFQLLGYDVEVRQLDESESSLQDIMMESEAIPSNVLIAFMVRAEAALKLLRDGQLVNGAELVYGTDTNRRVLSVVDGLEELPLDIKVTRYGIHLSAIFADMLNRQILNGEPMSTPALRFESEADDSTFLFFAEEEGWDLKGDQSLWLHQDTGH